MKTKTTFIAVLAAATLTAGVGTAVILNKAQPVTRTLLSVLELSLSSRLILMEPGPTVGTALL
jgi:hypothetical protein